MTTGDGVDGGEEDGGGLRSSKRARRVEGGRGGEIHGWFADGRGGGWSDSGGRNFPWHGSNSDPQPGTTNEVGQVRVERPNVPAHRQRTDERMALQDRKSREPLMHVRGGPKRSTSDGIGMRGWEEMEMGGHLDGQGVLCGDDEVPEKEQHGWMRAGRRGVGICN